MSAKNGDTVKVHYKLKDTNDELIESTYDSDPLEFTLGDEHVIPGFNNGIIGMEAGEAKKLHVPFADAYGPRDKEKIFDFDKSKAPESFEPQIGQTIKLHRPNGGAIMATVLERTVTGYKMDANHPFAGKDLIFDLELVEIVTGE